MELNRGFLRDARNSLLTHDPHEEAILRDTFRSQAKETLCEMLVLEAISPTGWHGDTSKTDLPGSMIELSSTFGQDQFFLGMRKVTTARKAEIAADFQDALETGLSIVAEKMRSLRNGITNAQSAESAAGLRMEIESVFREALPYANHPILREYYNLVVKLTFERSGSHATREDIPERVRAVLAETRGHFGRALEDMRASVEVEASVYSDMGRRSQRGGVGDFRSQEYRRTLGLLGAFSGPGRSAEESSAMGRLQRLHGKQQTVDANGVRVVSDLAMAFAPPLLGDIYSVGSELAGFDEHIKGCQPTMPKGFREGMCHTLESARDQGEMTWGADFFGAAPDGSGCRWKTAVQAGALVLSAVPIANRGLKVLRARNGMRALTAVESTPGRTAVQRAVGVGSELAEGSAVRGAKTSAKSRHALRNDERSRQKVLQLGGDLARTKRALSGALGRKTDLLYSMKTKGSSIERLRELDSLEGRIKELNAEIVRLAARGEKAMVGHSRTVLSDALSNPAVGKNRHLEEHFLPMECFSGQPNCDEHLKRVIALRRNKSMTTFFPKDVRMQDLLDPAKYTIVRERPVAMGLTTINIAESTVTGARMRYAIVICQNPRGCANSAFGEIETLYPVCGPGTKLLVGTRLLEGAPCDK